MIDQGELFEFAGRFGVPVEQIRRDHFISHVLAALGPAAADEANQLVFFGATALGRTWLPDLRLSEDIDLLVDTTEHGEKVRRSISLGIRREFLNHEWAKIGSKHDVETWNLTADGLIVKVQFALWRFGWKEAIMTAKTMVQLRHSDLPDSVELAVPTPSGFAAMKLMAWLDRSAPRDIYDLAALAEAGYIDTTALESVEQIVGYRPTATMIGNVGMNTVRAAWETELDHQLANPRSLDECVALVCQALAT